MIAVLMAAFLILAGCSSRQATSTRQLVVPLDEIKAPQSVTTVKLADYSVESPYTNVVHIVRLPDGQFLALSAKDPNGGCTVPWNEQNVVFWNPCHGGKYNIRGEVVEGPAIRGLDRFAVRAAVDERKVYVDVLTAPQHGAEPGQ